MTDRGRYLLVQIVTCVRIPAALAAIPFILADTTVGYVIAFSLYLFSEITDIMDGTLARAFKLESPFGKLFDPYCDSAYRLCVFFTLAMVGIFPLWVVWVMALRDVGVAYVRMAAIARGTVVQARLSGKLKAIVQGTAACTIVGIRFVPAFEPLIPYAYWVFAILVVAVTGWSFLDYGIAVLRAVHTEPK